MKRLLTLAPRHNDVCDDRTVEVSHQNPIPIGRWKTSAIARFLNEVFGADLRSLALFRIVLGFVILLDLAGRVTSLRAHYTDAGVLPRGIVLSTLNPWRWSILLINGTMAFQAILFLFTAVAAVLLIVGYRSRLMVFIAWVMVISLQVRNPLLSSGADTLMRMLLFWAMFIPLGERWSLDSLRATGSARTKQTRALSFGTAGLFLQIAFMYWFTAILKSDPRWVSEGTALYYALAAGHVARPYSDFLLQFPTLLRVLTHATLLLEFVGPLLLFSPFFRNKTRTIAIAALMSLHIGIFLTLDVGLFPVAGALCMVCFLPAWFWDNLLPRIEAALPGITRHVKRYGTMVLQPIVRAFTVVERPTTASVPHQSNGLNELPLPKTKSDMNVLTASWPGNLLAAFCLVFVLAWNISTVTTLTPPRASYPVAYGLALYQRWNMFAPRPPSITQWYVVRGVLENGQEVNLLPPIVSNDIELVVFFSWDELQDINGSYFGDKYWRKYFAAIGKEGRSTERLKFAAYTCRTWNNHYGGDVALDRVQIFRLTQRTLLNGEEAEINRSLLDNFGCT